MAAELSKTKYHNLVNKSLAEATSPTEKAQHTSTAAWLNSTSEADGLRIAEICNTLFDKRSLPNKPVKSNLGSPFERIIKLHVIQLK